MTGLPPVVAPVLAAAVDALPNRLRRKLEDDPSKPKLIKTFQGIGYMLAVPGTAESESGSDSEETEEAAVADVDVEARASS